MIHSPNCFATYKLTDIAERIQYGYTQSASTEEVGPKFLRITDIQENSVNWDTTPFCEITDEEFNKYKLIDGDIVVARTGATTGKSFLVTNPPPAVFASYLIRISLKKEIVLPEYLWLFMQSNDYWRQISIISNGTTQPGANATLLSNIQISIPPIHVQHKCVSVLKSAQELIDKRKAQIETLDQLTQSVFLEMFGDPVMNPKQYKTIVLKNLCEKIYGGGTPSKSKPEYYNGEIPWVTPKDMKSQLIDDSIDHITEIGLKGSTTNLIPTNSLLMVIRSGILKRTLPISINTNEVCINQDMKAFVLDKSIVLTEYLYYFFYFYQRILLSQVRSVTADNLDFDQVKEIEVPIAPMAEQLKFKDLFYKIIDSKNMFNKQLFELENNFNSLMQRAFKGELFND